MNYDNEVYIMMNSKSQNESFARVCVASFVSVLDPTVSDMEDIKMAVSEAVTNAIIHGYEKQQGSVELLCNIKDKIVTIEVTDKGEGIENIEKAREALYTSKPHMERSGMGFTVMESFMDSVTIKSTKGLGTKITMIKKITDSLD